MRKIGLFGGTFDPPHNGHIHMMHLAKECYELDEIYIIPTGKNPFKAVKTAVEKRLEMCQQAFGKFCWCKIVDVEATREGDSYTIDTVEYLVGHDMQFREAAKFFLLGQEVAYSLPEWKSPDLLVAIAQPVVISAEAFDQERARGASPNVTAALERGWIEAKPLCLSSTDVRERIAHNLPVDHLVPLPVLSYITTNHLYRR